MFADELLTSRTEHEVDEDLRLSGGFTVSEEEEGAAHWVASAGDGFRIGLDNLAGVGFQRESCLLYTSPSPRDLSTSRMPSSA